MANASDRTSGGVYKAWLSLGALSPATRFTRNPGPYVQVDGAATPIAANWAELTSGTLQNVFNTMDNGLTVAAVPWSDTLANGTPANSGQNCAGWTDGSASVSGRVGRTTTTSADWSDDSSQSNHACNELGRLLCFEQG